MEDVIWNTKAFLPHHLLYNKVYMNNIILGTSETKYNKKTLVTLRYNQILVLFPVWGHS